MSAPGSRTPALYRALKDVLERRAEIVVDTYEPDAIQKRYPAAEVDPRRLTPPTGPDSPTVVVRWEIVTPHDEFRVDYADPNGEFHCGWHRDEAHPELGDVHFQYQTAAMDAPSHEPATFDADAPVRILCTCLERLFEDVLPALDD